MGVQVPRGCLQEGGGELNFFFFRGRNCHQASDEEGKSGRVGPRQGTAICNFGAPSPLDLKVFSPVYFSLFSRSSVKFSKEMAPKCGENCPISGWRKKRRILSRLWLSWSLFFSVPKKTYPKSPGTGFVFCFLLHFSVLRFTVMTFLLHHWVALSNHFCHLFGSPCLLTSFEICDMAPRLCAKVSRKHPSRDAFFFRPEIA